MTSQQHQQAANELFWMLKNTCHGMEMTKALRIWAKESNVNLTDADYEAIINLVG